MRLRFVVSLLIAAALAFAYAAPAPSSNPNDAAARATTRRVAAGGDTVAATLDVTVGEEVKFNLHVTNGSPKRVELRFPNGKTHDVAVLDAQGREVWRWSTGRMFTQSMQSRILDAADTLTFSESWRPKTAGSYTAVASLLSENHPKEQRVGFSLPGTAVSVR